MSLENFTQNNTPTPEENVSDIKDGQELNIGTEKKHDWKKAKKLFKIGALSALVGVSNPFNASSKEVEKADVMNSATNNSEVYDKSQSKDGVQDFSKLSVITDEMAEHLSKYKGDINLNNLTSISDTAIEHLSKHKGDLHLDGLTSISDIAAGYLRDHEGDLYLNGLTSLSDIKASHLVHNTGAVYLNGVKTLSERAAQQLRKYTLRGGKIYLHGLTSLPRGAYNILSGRFIFYTNKIFFDPVSIPKDVVIEDDK